MTEEEAVRKILDEVYAAREQIYEETKNLTGEEYIAYFGDRARDSIRRNGYNAVRSNDGLGYTLCK